MRPLSAQEMLDVWECGATQSSLVRALTLLAAAAPEMSDEALWRLSIGERNARLLTLREWAFGARMTSAATCPVCGEKLELDFAVSDLRATSQVDPNDLVIDAENYRVRFRLPTSADLLTADSYTALLNRCVVAIESSDAQIDPSRLPVPVIDALAERMAQADPQANIELALTCPNCQHAWQAVLDVATYFWNEINGWAIRTLRDVHTLARAYGWREADILGLSPQRRQMYLNLVGT